MAKPIFACGILIFAALASVARFDARAHPGWFLGLMGMAALAYLVTIWHVAHRPRGSARELAVCALLAVAWRVALFGAAPLVSDDAYRYVWDGRVQRFGLSPYETVPDDPALAHLHTDVTRRIDPTSAALPTIYPPAAELFFRSVTTLHESVTSMVVIIIICDLLTAVVMWRWLVTAGRNPWWVLAYLWHPLVSLEGAGGGHVDFLGTFFVLSTAYALSRGRSLLASLALAVAFAVKFLPVVLVPLLWRRVRLRDALLGAVVVVLLYLPFREGMFISPVGSLWAYVEHWRFNGPLFAWLESLFGAPALLVIAVSSGLIVSTVARARLGPEAPAAWAWPMAVTLLLLPAVYPWYLIWLTPFLTSRGMWPLLVWTLTSLLTYVVWVPQLSGFGWILPPWVEPVEYGLVAATGGWVWWTRSTWSRSF
jgi:alpha-1,6-mannosyltransferase